MTIACGDFHTSTHGAGYRIWCRNKSSSRPTATQTLALSPLKVRRIEVNGKLQPGVYAKDVILHIIKLGVNGGLVLPMNIWVCIRSIQHGREDDSLQYVY